MLARIKTPSYIPKILAATALTLASTLSLAEPTAVTFKDRLIGFDNVEVMGTTYNVRFTQYTNELPVGSLDTLHTAKQAEAANEVLIDLIKQHGVPVVGRKHNEYCKPGMTCRIASPYEINTEFSDSNIWVAIKRFQADENHLIIPSSIKDEHTAYSDKYMLQFYNYYAQWVQPEEY